MELHLFETLKNAFESSTLSNNRFLSALNSASWDKTFYADGEHYFCKGGFCFTTPSLNPFEVTSNWMPSAMFSDGSCIEF